MTIHERMIPRTEREKDLLKYGRSQIRKSITKLLDEHQPEVSPDSGFVGCECGATDGIWPLWYDKHLFALIKGEK